MELNEHDSLAALEYLMEEFFSPGTSNARKQEIEQQLNSFKCVPQFWKLCVFCLAKTSSQYVTMFALSTLEAVINQQWTRVDWNFREELKNILYGYLIEEGNSAPHFIRAKYAKLLVSVAKQDWPTNYPNFFDNILELLKLETGQLIGLILLKTTSEEFMGLNSVFENGRKDEITRLLHHYIPSVFAHLNSILINLGCKPRHTATATPPPSPTQSLVTAPSLSQQLAQHSSAFKPDCKALNKEALETVQHLFTWVPVDRIPPGIIKGIFNFTNVASYAQDDHDMCVLAMSTINELLYRKCTPPGSQDFFVQLYFYTLELLRDVTCSSSFRMESLDPIFVEKLTELLVLIVEQHLWRLEMEPNFSALDFLSLLYQLTIELQSAECYLRCLSVWAAFLKQMKPERKEKYSQAFSGLLVALVKKIQFSTNPDQLKEINISDLNDDNETDWDIFLTTSIEVISMIAEHAPMETLNHVLVPWKGCYDIYRRLDGIVDRHTCSLICDQSESERLTHMMTDFSSLTQTLARLSPLFFDQENEEVASSPPLINTLIEKLVEGATLATSVRFYNLKTSEALRDSFITNHSQILAALKTYLIWMTRNDNKLTVDSMKLFADITIPVIHVSTPQKVTIAAAHLFLALSSLQCAPDLITLPEVANFINLAPNLKLVDPATNYVIYSAIANLLLRSNDASRNAYLVGVFFDGLTWSFRDLSPSSGEQRVREVAESVLPALSHVVDFCKDFNVVAKRRLFGALKATIEHAVFLFPSYVKYGDVGNCILVFFLNVLRVLPQQMGVEGTKGAVQVFLEVAIKEQGNGNFLDKLLQIFQLVVESPGSSFKSFLPGILQLCMDNVYPFILSHGVEKPDSFMALITLLHSILLHRWVHFYDITSHFGPQSPTSSPKMEQLKAMLEVFGQGLLQQDINIFKLSLASLEDLNSRHRLYLKVLLRYDTMSKYENVLVRSLLEKSQSLLSEDIQVAVYNMASVNFEHFFATFLPQFVADIEGVSDRQKAVLLANFVQNYDKDMPTFVQHLQVFVNNARHYRLMSTLPSSVS